MVTATDNGDTPLSGSARVVVRVLNCTEREFFYSMPHFYFEMRENGNQFTDGRTGQVIGASFSPDVAEFYPMDFPQNPFSINLNVKTFLNLQSAVIQCYIFNTVAVPQVCQRTASYWPLYWTGQRKEGLVYCDSESQKAVSDCFY